MNQIGENGMKRCMVDVRFERYGGFGSDYVRTIKLSTKESLKLEEGEFLSPRSVSERSFKKIQQNVIYVNGRI